MVNPKHAFWKALLFSLMIFLIGFMIGFFVENMRIEKVQMSIINSEINLIDEQLKGDVLKGFDINCDISKESIFEFADRIYSEALKLEEYDISSKFTNELTVFHKRYDMLRMQLWLDAINVHSKCSSEFHTIVYFYQYNPSDIETKAEQLTFNRLLIQLKEDHPDEILLIPIASNLNIASIDAVLKKYSIEKTPVLIIDENLTVSEIPEYSQLENIVF